MDCNCINLLKNRAFWFAVFVSAAFLWGTLSTWHYLPAQFDQYLQLQVAILLAVAVVVGAWGGHLSRMGATVVLWMLLLVYVAAQPWLHTIDYPDALIFPLGSLFLSLAAAWVVSNFGANEKETVMGVLGVVCIVSGLSMVLTQCAQLFHWQIGNGWIFLPDTDRLVGNIGQVNQAAYVEVLAMAAVLYWTQTGKNYLRVYGLALLLFLPLAVGIGFSASRGGFLMALVVVPVAMWLFTANTKIVLVRSVVMWAVFALGYVIGTVLMHHFSEQNISSVSRLVAGGDHQRLLIYERAIKAFLEQPLLGIGWGKFNIFGIEHAQELSYVAWVENAHMLPLQIAAELGVVGLLIVLGFSWILWRALKQPVYSRGQKLALLVILVTLIYSCTEFPLWFLRFLMLFAVCLAIVDPLNFRLRLNCAFGVSTASVCVALYAGFLGLEYQPYRSALNAIAAGKPQFAGLAYLPKTFGYTNLREILYFTAIRPIPEEAEKQAEMGKRALGFGVSSYLLEKEADMLLLSGQIKEAQHYFRAACLFEYARECDNSVVPHLRNMPHDLQKQVWPEFARWYQLRFHRELPMSGSGITDQFQPVSAVSVEKK